MDYPTEMPNPGNDEMFVLVDELGKPIPNFAYKITTASSEIYRGFTNSRGEAIRVYTGSNIEDMLFEADTNEDHADK